MKRLFHTTHSLFLVVALTSIMGTLLLIPQTGGAAPACKNVELPPLKIGSPAKDVLLLRKELALWDVAIQNKYSKLMSLGIVEKEDCPNICGPDKCEMSKADACEAPPDPDFDLCDEETRRRITKVFDTIKGVRKDIQNIQDRVSEIKTELSNHKDTLEGSKQRLANFDPNSQVLYSCTTAIGRGITLPPPLFGFGTLYSMPHSCAEKDFQMQKIAAGVGGSLLIVPDSAFDYYLCEQ